MAEIYNYVELREMLLEKGATFATQSDKSYHCIVCTYERKMCRLPSWYVRSGAIMKKKLFGAHVITSVLNLYTSHNKVILHFSHIEKKSIMHVMEDKGVNPTSLQHYFTYQYGPEPETLTIDVNKIDLVIIS